MAVMSPVGAAHEKTAPAAGNDECSVPPFAGAAPAEAAAPIVSPIVPRAVTPAMTARLRSERIDLPFFPLLTSRHRAPEVGGWRRSAPLPKVLRGRRPETKKRELSANSQTSGR